MTTISDSAKLNTVAELFKIDGIFRENGFESKSDLYTIIEHFSTREKSKNNESEVEDWDENPENEQEDE